ncbi:MAG: hypothetical protein F6K24_02120 [Okeania sp. SIO2D1]|nr:hypothetical protein [Okeania sp. SIO2D1]
MVYQFTALFNLGLLLFSLASYLAKLNDLIEPIFLAVLVVLGLSYAAVKLDSSKEIKIIAGVIVGTLLLGGIVGWM